jgi:hypothetical protein
MKALSHSGVDYYPPHWYAYAVEFGLDADHRGVLSRLENELILRRWLIENREETVIAVEGYRVVFSDEDAAQRCFEAFA